VFYSSGWPHPSLFLLVEHARATSFSNSSTSFTRERTNLSGSPVCVKLTFHNRPAFLLIANLNQCMHRFFVSAEARRPRPGVRSPPSRLSGKDGMCCGHICKVRYCWLIPDPGAFKNDWFLGWIYARQFVKISTCAHQERGY
jgi:hypothetical protein